MTRNAATEEAQATADALGVELALVQEGPHADDFATRDTDGQSYGYCPADAVKILYKYGKVVATVKPAAP